MKTKAKKPAFSLIELIIYVAITSTIVVAMLSFSISILQVRGDAEFSREVFENARYVGDALSRSIRDAEDITSVTEAHPGEIVTDSDGALVLTINTATKTVGTQTIRYLRIQDPSGWDQITSDKVNVTNFSIDQLQRDSEPKNIQFSITIESLDGIDALSFRTSVSPRE